MPEPPILRLVPAEPIIERAFKPLALPDPVAKRAPAEPAMPLLAAIAAEPPPKPRPPRDTSLALAWAASLVAVALLFAAAIAFHPQIVRVWPPSERAYVALGLR